MNVQVGQRIAVNLAVFIHSPRRSMESIPCEVVAVRAGEVQVSTDYPYRKLFLWISPHWIDGEPETECPKPEHVEESLICQH